MLFWACFLLLIFNFIAAVIMVEGLSDLAKTNEDVYLYWGTSARAQE